MICLTVLIVLAVAFVNGWTDAPNSVAASVASGVLPIKKAMMIAAIADFIGSVTVGMISGKVSEKVILLADFGNDERVYVVSVFSSMLSVVIWAVLAWYFGIPTSESHALLAGIFGSSVAINKGIENINYSEWSEVLFGMILSVAIGFLSGYLLSKLIFLIREKKNNENLKNYQIISSVLTAFLHGAQDSQKFVGIIIAVLSVSFPDTNHFYLHLAVTLLCAFMISLGTVTGGERIINTVGNDMVQLDRDSGFSADISGLFCLLVSTLCGILVSTTHIKTSSVLGAGATNKIINKSIVIRLFATWILTFPACGMLSFLITYFIIN